MCDEIKHQNQINELKGRVAEIQGFLHVCLGVEGFNHEGRLDDRSFGPRPWVTHSELKEKLQDQRSEFIMDNVR